MFLPVRYKVESLGQAIAVDIQSALLGIYEAKGANININGLESEFKLLCKPHISSRLMKKMLGLYSRIQSDNFISHSEISHASKHKVNQTCIGESQCALWLRITVQGSVFL